MKKRQPETYPAGSANARNRTMAARSDRQTVTSASNGLGKPGSGKRKIRRKMPLKKKLIIAGISIMTVIVLIVGAVYGYALYLDSKIGRDPNLTIPDEFNTPTESWEHPAPVVDGIMNILLLGVDTRSTDSSNINERSDSMMILTIDTISKKIKLTSLQRDMLVYIPGKTEPNKLNSANASGGPLLAIRVVNETLRLSISKYVVVNMVGMEEIIDLAGGVMIDVSKAELPYVEGGLSKSGLQLLNGFQAVSYSRIRHLDSDYMRMARQRKVLQALFNAFRDADLLTKNNMISEGLGYLTTNLSTSEIADIGINLIPMMDGEIEQMQIPVDGDFFSGYYNGGWVNRCDYNAMIPKLQQFIFGKTFPFDQVKLVPKDSIDKSVTTASSATTAATQPTQTSAPTETTLAATTTGTTPAVTLSTTTETTIATTAATSATESTAAATSETVVTTTTTTAAA